MSDIAGLTAHEAALRLAQYGPNVLQTGRTRSFAVILLGTLREPMFLFLIAAAGLYLAVGDFGEGLFLLGGALVSIGLVVAQDARSERALLALRQLAEPFCRVIRDGVQQRIPARDLTPGDHLLVTEGERVPADGLLQAGDVLEIDESLLTGESVPVLRRPGDQTEIFAGTMVVRGHGLARVTRTGAQTNLGALGKSLAGIQHEQTPLQRATARIVAPVSVFALVFCVLIAIAYGVLRGEWIAGGLAGLTVAISLLPEEFPMVLAVFLALGSWRLARHRVLVRRAAVIETLGVVSMLCVDKTGTLTENRMRVAMIWPHDTAPDEIGDAPPARAVLEAALLACSVHPIDPMDRAIHVALAVQSGGVIADHGGAPFRTSPLRPELLAVIQYWRDVEGKVVAATKGAPEAVFKLCGLSAEQQALLQDSVAKLAARGMRVLAVAKSEATEPEGAPFEFMGLVGFVDPLRGDVLGALQQARQAGIDVAMITGDYPGTALEIARQAGLATRHGVLTGAEIAALDPVELRARIAEIRIFARVMPEQKLALVEAFKANGHIVAMTGDGVNDAPALEKADVGIAMGGRGTDVAREAADLILLDDSFASIVGGVRLGRRIFANLRKALVYIAAVHVPVAGVALVPILLGAPPLLYPMHVVLMELIIDPVCSLVFEAEPSERAAMRRPPRSIHEPLFGKRQIGLAAVQGSVLLAAVLGVYGWALSTGMPVTQARGLGFITLVLGNLVLAFAETFEFGTSLVDRRRWIFWAIAAAAGLVLVAAFSIPALSRIFYVDPPQLGALGVALLAAASAGGWYGAVKAFGLARPSAPSGSARASH